MTLGTQEHINIMAAFEKYAKSAHNGIRFRLDREQKSEWPKGHVYQDGLTNDFFKLYSAGYANARCVYLQGGPDN
jgi:hypothetical protein